MYKKNGVLKLLFILYLFFLLTSPCMASRAYYKQFINGKKKLGFKPGKNFINEIYFYIRNKYPQKVSKNLIFSGAKKELSVLVGAYGFSPSKVNSISADSKILVNFLRKFKGKVSRNLAVYAVGNGMVKALEDPESKLIIPSKSKNPRRDIIPKGYGGVGILIEKRKGQIIIIYPFEKGPCRKAGIKAGDIILSIDGQNVKSWSLDDVMNRLRGKVGSIVSIKLKRKNYVFSKNIVRDKIKLNPVYVGVSKGRVGYIRISYFSKEYPLYVYRALGKFKKCGIENWILDLRDNAGGSLNQLIVMGSLFFPTNSPVLIIKYRDKKRPHLSVARKNLTPPRAIIVNSYTTGSAETLAADFREYCGSKIYGTRTRGNTAVSQYFKLSGGATLKLTVGNMLTGHGKNLHKKGLRPNGIIPQADNPSSEDKVINKVLSKIRK